MPTPKKTAKKSAPKPGAVILPPAPPSLRDRIEAGEFANRNPYAQRTKDPATHETWRAAETANYANFRAALEADYDVAKWPQALRDRVWRETEERRDGSGFASYIDRYEEIVAGYSEAFDAGFKAGEAHGREAEADHRSGLTG